MVIVLTEQEMRKAGLVGFERNIRSLVRNSKPYFASHNQGVGNGIFWATHIQGAMAELAACKALDLHWTGSVDTFVGEADIPPNIEVRYSHQLEFTGKVRPKDNNRHHIVAVTGDAPHFDVLGWMPIFEARGHIEWERDPGGRGKPAIFIPSDQLRDINELAEMMGAYYE